MLNLTKEVLFGSESFGYGIADNGNPAMFLFGIEIYIYALIIVVGMCVAILVGGFYFKKRGIDPYDICTYALVVIPLGVLGARLYVYIFPWAGRVANWSTFFNFRSGGLGIYGGVIMGFFGALATAKIKKQDFGMAVDCMFPGVLIAQSIGRWGNFVNQEAHGPLIADTAFHWFPFGVEIGGQWYYATFFYESMATLLGFVICLFLMRSKKYKIGWISAFYGIYYGIVRLLIEGMRTDSLFLWIGQTQTDIKISQLVSVVTIVLGFWTLSKIYRRQLHGFYSKLFKSEKEELQKSRWVLYAVAFLLACVAVLMFILGGESKFIVGFFALLIAIYSVLGIFALNDRLKLYCDKCGERNNVELNEKKLLAVKSVYFVAVAAISAIVAVVLLVLGIVNSVANNIVVSVIFAIVAGLFVFAILKDKMHDNLKKQNFENPEATFVCSCGEQKPVALSAWLLVLFPFKKYKDLGVSHLKPFVEVKNEKKEA